MKGAPIGRWCWMAAIALFSGFVGYGGTAWGLALAVSVAISWGLAQSRREAFGVMVTYYLAAGRGLFHGGGVFFAGVDSAWAQSTLWGAVIWIAPALVLAGAWSICWGRRLLAARSLLALVMVCAPPVGWIGWANPIAGAGMLFPSMGWAGLSLQAALFCLLAVIASAVVGREWTVVRNCVVAGAVMHATVALVTLVVPKAVHVMPSHWVALDTHVGRSDGYDTVLELEHVAFKAVNDGAQVVVLPEAVGGWWNLNRVQWAGYQDILSKRGVTVLVGAEQSLDYRRRENGLFAVGVDDGAVLGERVPVPLGMWKPWSKTRTIVSNWGGAGVARIQGENVAYLICYEQLLVLPVLVSVAHHPDLLIGAANLWWAKGTSIEGIQRSTLSAWGRLFGLPILSATNV